MLPSESDRSFARRVQERGLVRPEQLEECLHLIDELASVGAQPLPSLRELLVRKGYLTDLPFQETGLLPTPSGEVENAEKDPANRIGRYVRVRKLGTGGMGEVWKAWDTELGRWIALKMLRVQDEEQTVRFRREAQTAARLVHPNIAAIYEAGENYIAMQLVDGSTLAAHPRTDRRKLADLVRHAALAVHYAHSQGVIHRDLKPANVMIDRAGAVFVLDFGLAKRTRLDDQTVGASGVVGTPSYMAPEQARGQATAQSDVYGIGAILYELVTGRPPFTGGSATEVLLQVMTAEPIWGP